MVTFELRSVAGGWNQARFGPSDQVDYALYDGDPTGEAPALTSYDSVHTFLRLYDLARLERTTHPEFLGLTLRETGRTAGEGEDGDGDELLELSVHGASVRTTYPELRAALESFFADLFPALDRETAGERPALETFDVGVLDLAQVYDEVVEDA